jgi:peptidoglycan/LPS O-acetylase OafA/YrhL
MSAPSKRYVFVDGIRGLAAASVMLYHLGTGDLAPHLARVLSRHAIWFFERGWIGVHVFFAISGFVIAHTIAHAIGHEMTPRRALRFSLRRQVRLDPPYWCAIALGVAIPFIGNLAHPGLHWVPSLRDVALNALYVNDLLGTPAISWVFWSLAIEVQFYLLFVLVLALFRRAPSLLPWIVAASAIASLHWSLAWRFPHAWFTQHWYLFALGALTRWATMRDRRAHPALSLTLAAIFIACGVHYGRLEPLAGGVVCASLHLAAWRDGLSRWLGARPLQFLGATSYGIYLFHTPFAGPVRVAFDAFFGAPTIVGAFAVFFAQIAVTLLAAALLHRTIEGWAMRLSSRIRWHDDPVSPAINAARESDCDTAAAAAPTSSSPAS